MNMDDAFASLNAASKQLKEVEDFLFSFPDEVERDEMLQYAADLHLLKRYVGDLFDECQRIVTDRVGFVGSPVVVNGATVEIKAGASRKTWDHKSLMSDVSRRLVDKNIDLETGEIAKSPRELIEEAIDYMGVSYWKVSKLKELHIDADQYCEVSEGKKNLVIRRDS